MALSGGADSVVLLHLLKRAGYNTCAAHCNFKLRGTDSDEDEKFVDNYCAKIGVKLYKTIFDTQGYAAESKLSIEMAARELRYRWFQQVAHEAGCDYIATGHHLNDSIETVFLNLARGTGINGIKGVPVKNGNIIRPLLFATREQILEYIQANGLTYREDASNASEMYLRNLIRHKVIPVMKQVNPEFDKVMARNIDYFADARDLVDQRLETIKNDVVKNNRQRTEIDILSLKQYEPLNTILFELLSPYGFNTDSVYQIIEATHGVPGKTFSSETHHLLIDRRALIIEPKMAREISIQFNSVYRLNVSNAGIKATIVPKEEFKLQKRSDLAQLDADKVDFPLTYRPWQPGDYFFPLGMSNKKKISDFLIDLKVDRFEKSRVMLLLSNNEVIWVLGHRIDDRYKVTEKTKSVLILNLKSA